MVTKTLITKMIMITSKKEVTKEHNERRKRERERENSRQKEKTKTKKGYTFFKL